MMDSQNDLLDSEIRRALQSLDADLDGLRSSKLPGVSTHLLPAVAPKNQPKSTTMIPGV